jgi:hypothetical protein
MQNLSKDKTLFHMIVEKDAIESGYANISYTVYIDLKGEPVLKTLKVTKSKRIKYGK